MCSNNGILRNVTRVTRNNSATNVNAFSETGAAEKRSPASREAGHSQVTRCWRRCSVAADVDGAPAVGGPCLLPARVAVGVVVVVRVEAGTDEDRCCSEEPPVSEAVVKAVAEAAPHESPVIHEPSI